ncbi:MAG: type II toxin-antitoxin system RelE/ParE family toxin [Thermoanaerobaculia bacterium]
MKYSLHPGAEADLREAAEFYRERAGSSLSQSLFIEFEQAVDLLLQHPRLGTLWRYGKRRYVMRRFPYSLIYTAVGEEVRILAVAHHSRRPGYWRGRR